MGVLNIFKNNARLERNLEKAKEVQERDGEFQGPDGKYVATFTRVSTGEKKDNDGNEVGWAVIELHVADVEGQEDYSGQKLPIIYFRFTDNASTQQPKKNRSDSSKTLSQLGVDTTVSDDEFDDAVNEARGGLVNVSVKTNPDRSQPPFNKRLYINSLAAEGNKDVTYSEKSSDDAEEPENKDEEEAPFVAEVAQEADEAGSGEADDVKASEWVGFDVQYQRTPRAKLRQYRVKDADDDEDTVTLVDQDGGELKDVPFSKLVFPED
jgi:hypothetical protein